MLPHEPALIKQHTDTNDLRVYSTAERDIIVRCPLHLRRREWAIAVAKNPSVVSAEVTDFTPTARLLAKHGGFPLDKVKEWTLEWPDTHRYADTAAAKDSATDKERRNVSEHFDRFIGEALTYPRAGERTGINSFPNNTATDIAKARTLLESGLTSTSATSRRRASALSAIGWVTKTRGLLTLTSPTS